MKFNDNEIEIPGETTKGTDYQCLFIWSYPKSYPKVYLSISLASLKENHNPNKGLSHCHNYEMNYRF